MSQVQPNTSLFSPPTDEEIGQRKQDRAAYRLKLFNSFRPGERVRIPLYNNIEGTVKRLIAHAIYGDYHVVVVEFDKTHQLYDPDRMTYGYYEPEEVEKC